MGVVWKAEDQVLGRPVAIKLLPPETARDETRRRMFLDEAKLASSLNQSNIVQIYEFDREGDLPFIVMEYVEGEPLSRKIKRRPMQPEFVSDIGHQVARAMSKAHRKRLLHRDLKPSNILVTPEGEAKVVDFGLATLFGGNKPSASTGMTGISQTETRPYDHDGDGKGHAGSRQVVGTLSYMSPEQLRGGKLDGRSDIFSFGTILYEMTTGQRPFLGSTTTEVASEIQKARPRRVHEIVPKVPIELERIIHKSLSGKPSERYQTMEDLAVDLMRLGKDLDSGSSPSYEEALGSSGSVAVSGWHPGTWSRWGKLFGALALVAVLAVSAVWVTRRTGTGSRVAAGASAGDTVDISMTGRVRQLTFTGTNKVPLWSPDGRTIAYTDLSDDGTTIRVMPAEGGTSRSLEGFSKWQLAWNWNPAGTGVLVHGTHPTKEIAASALLDLFGEAPKMLAENAVYPDLHPNGTMLAMAFSETNDQTGIWVKDLSSGDKKMLTPAHGEGTAAYKPQWSPSGDLLAYHRWNGWGHEVWLLDPVSGDDRKIDTGPVEPAGHYDWTPDGHAIVSGAQLARVWSLWKIPLDGTRPVQLTPGSESEMHASISPDGQAVVFERMRDVSSLLILDTETGVSTEPARMSVAARHAVFSAGSETLTFQALVNGTWQLWTASMRDGSSPHPILKIPGFSTFNPAVAENEILHVRSDVRPTTIFGKVGWSQTLWASNPAGGMQRHIAAAGDHVSRIPPRPQRTGRILYATHAETGGEELRVLDLAEESRVLMKDSLKTGFSSFGWGSEDNEVLIVTSEENVPHLIALDVETGETRELLARGSVTLNGEDGALQTLGAIALSSDRSRLALIASGTNAKHSALYLLDLESMAFRKLRTFEDVAHPDFIAWSPDDRKIVMDLHREQSDIFVLEDLGDTLASPPAS